MSLSYGNKKLVLLSSILGFGKESKAKVQGANVSLIVWGSVKELANGYISKAIKYSLCSFIAVSSVIPYFYNGWVPIFYKQLNCAYPISIL